MKDTRIRQNLISSNQSTLETALDTYPVYAQKFSLVFEHACAYAPSGPNQTERSDQEYRSVCAQAGIIPYSRFELRSASEGFLPTIDPIKSLLTEHGYWVETEIVNGLLSGKRFYQVRFSKEESDETGLEELREQQVPILRAQGYRLARGTIHSEDDYRRLVRIRFNTLPNGYEIDLRAENAHDTDSFLDLLSWHKRLAQLAVNL